MTSFIGFGHVGKIGGSVDVPNLRGKWWPGHGGLHARQLLLTDAKGTCTLRLKNAVAGSRYRIEVVAGGALVADGDVPGAPGIAVDLDVAVPYYAAGNPANDLRIKVRKASAAPYYRPFETQASAQAGVVVAYISQELDQ